MSTSKRQRQKAKLAKRRAAKPNPAGESLNSRPPVVWGTPPPPFTWGSQDQIESEARADAAHELLLEATVALIAGRSPEAERLVDEVCALPLDPFEEHFHAEFQTEMVVYGAAETLAGACWEHEERYKKLSPYVPWSWIPAAVYTAECDLDPLSARAVRYLLWCAGQEFILDEDGLAFLDATRADAPLSIDPYDDTVVALLIREGASQPEAVMACLRGAIWTYYQAGLVSHGTGQLKAPPDAADTDPQAASQAESSLINV
jgi:hypothetical protein